MEATLLLAFIIGFMLLVVGHLYLRDHLHSPKHPSPHVLPAPAAYPPLAPLHPSYPPPFPPPNGPPPILGNPLHPPPVPVGMPPMQPMPPPVGNAPQPSDGMAMVYMVISQRLNPNTQQWEDEGPPLPFSVVHKLAFVAVHRRRQLPSHPVLTFVSVRCEGLKAILRNCLKYDESVFDAAPFVDAFKMFHQKETLEKELEEKMKLLDGPVSEDRNGSSPSTRGHDSDSNPTQSARAALRRDVQHLEALLSFLEIEFAPLKEKSESLRHENVVTFDILWLFFHEGSEVIYKDVHAGLKSVGKITHSAYFSGVGAQASYFEIMIQYIDYNGETLYYQEAMHKTYYFRGSREIGLLEVQPLADDMELKDKLRARGRAFVALKGRHYKQYAGDEIARDSLGITPLSFNVGPVMAPPPPPPPVPMGGFPGALMNFKVSGRVMIDCQAGIKYGNVGTYSINLQPHRRLHLEDVDEDELHLCSPTVLGYSFVTKTWGRFTADRFCDIRWDTRAFDHLVLSQDKKNLIKSLVLADRSKIISDVIANKAGGFIVILHGKPGTGKTLTAEAAAELVHKPLMILSATELGWSPEAVEVNMRRILEMCKAWDAIILIDEAEVYLEARSLGNAPRNGMVSAFLRVLEYHQQVIFLTTNHITRLDAAFKSRVSVALKYPDLDKKTRQEIWDRFLGMAGVKVGAHLAGADKEGFVDNEQLHKLADRNLNGRQIKNAVRTAQAVAATQHRSLTYEVLTEVIDSTGDFGDFEGACECQQRKISYYGGNEKAMYLKALNGGLPN